MQQWHECKKEAKGAILFFRLGDFYEAFNEDAKLVSKELDLTLTQRQEIPMCGIPWHSSDAYIEKLVARGYRVAIAEQVEDPKKAKGLVSRKLVKIFSPATLIPTSSGDDKSHSFFASIAKFDNRYGLAVLDLASASFTVFETDSARELSSELFRQSPKELLVSSRMKSKEKELMSEINFLPRLVINTQEEWLFDPISTKDRLLQHFHVQTLDGFGLKNMQPSLAAAGALLHYLSDWQLCSLEHIQTIRPTFLDSHLFLDRATLTNLEVLEPQDKSRSDTSLVALLDETKTPMGARLLRQWLKSPLVHKEQIKLRQQAVKEFYEQQESVKALPDALSMIRDLERLMYRIKTQAAGPKEYVSLRLSHEALQVAKQIVSSLSCVKLKTLTGEMHSHDECVNLIRRALVDAPPFRVSDGGLFRQGFNQELDELLALRQNSQEWLVNYQERLKQSSGIKTLKVGYTRMFGYYIEVSRAQAEKVPQDFIRRQTLVNGERYITPELKEYEEKILTADSRIQEIEERLFQELRHDVSLWHDSILNSARAVAEVDVLFSFAEVARKRRYICPEITESTILDIKEGRHPVIESLASTSHFVANNLLLDGEDKALICLTGPNMAGKSTYIRQIALLVIMAQTGSFIPAKEASIGIIDKVFSRIGASDDLARGQSTFMVEMAETASILNLATERSLVILDEIGRGTSTYDGISIAWAVAEFLLKGQRKPKTLFATHYYELTELAKKIKGAENHTVAISDTEDGVVFLRKIIPGSADRSYGIHVARLAGMPESVILRAEELLKKLERTPSAPKKDVQQDLFLSPITPTQSKVLKAIDALDCNKITPLEALVKLMDLKKNLHN